MKVVIVTGGTGLVGKAIVKSMLEQGYTVVTSSRNPDKKKFVKENKIEEFEENFYVFHLDYFNTSSVNSFVHNLEKEKIYPEVIIHNARSLNTLKIENNGQSSLKNFLDEYQMGVVSPYKLNNLILDSNIGSKLNNIIFVSSIYGVVAPTPRLYDNFEQQSPIQYGVTKAAQIHLTKELAVRLSDKGVRVNAISLGGIKGRAKQSFVDKYSELNPQNKMLSVEDIIKPIEFLIKDDSKSITGHNLIVDGGWTIW
ncbi:Short-chain dehydrogenase/reductase family protein [Tenacibaculum sp. 190524A02b]|uniref:Short-chain dehydrogenase/reductase family protein n=1 Tax=Tenacibaculum vairaonense TaxID=3137860 RepID=A0ABP1FBV0_9FLAO